MSESIEENRSIVGKILGIRQEEYIRLDSYSNCIQFSIDHFLKRYTEEIEYVVTRNLGKTEYFIGLRGEGLGVRV